MPLYDDIGGAHAVRAVLDAFYPRVLADATLSAFFLGVDIERLKKTQEAFFATALGGPNTYSGRRFMPLTPEHGYVERTTKCSTTSSWCSRECSSIWASRTEIHQWLAVFEGARGQILNR